MRHAGTRRADDPQLREAERMLVGEGDPGGADGVSDPDVSPLANRYDGLNAEDAERLKQLERGNVVEGDRR